jgi:hypothetical protein
MHLTHTLVKQCAACGVILSLAFELSSGLCNLCDSQHNHPALQPHPEFSTELDPPRGEVITVGGSATTITPSTGSLTATGIAPILVTAVTTTSWESLKTV